MPSPSSKPPPLLRDYFLLFPDPDGQRILLSRAAVGWSLPCFSSTDPNLFSGQQVAEEVRERWGVDATLLRCLDAFVDPESGRWRWAVLALEGRRPEWALPADARWVSAEEMAELPLAREEPRTCLMAWLAEQRGGAAPATRPPWARPGWLPGITAWVSDQLGMRGEQLTGPPEQVKTWGISCLLRGHTGAGDVFVKACPSLPLFTNEPAVTAVLGRLFPDAVPVPLAIDAERRWMLMADFGGVALEEAPPDAWDGLLPLWGRMQASTAHRASELLAAGCVDRRLPVLAAGIGPLLRESRAFAVLDDARLARLEALVPLLEATCAQLAAYHVPPTLLHGDLHAGNVAIRPGGPLIYDWSDACISHPFLDLVTLLEDDDDRTPDPGRTAALRDLYLEQWTAYEPMARLREAAALAWPLGMLHQAISYQHIVVNLEPSERWVLRGDWSRFLRALVATLERLPGATGT